MWRSVPVGFRLSACRAHARQPRWVYSCSPGINPGPLRQATAARQVERDVDHARLVVGGHRKLTALEHLEHRTIVRQHLGHQLSNLRVTCDDHEVAHQARADAQFLVRVVHGKGDLGAARCREDIPPAACDQLPAVALEHRGQRDMVHKIDVQEIFELSFAESALRREEPAIARFVARPLECREQLGAVGGSERANLKRASVAQALDGGVLGRVHVSSPARADPMVRASVTGGRDGQARASWQSPFSGERPLRTPPSGTAIGYHLTMLGCRHACIRRSEKASAPRGNTPAQEARST